MTDRYYVLNEFPEDEEDFIDALREVGCPQSLLDKANCYFQAGFCELQNLVHDGKALATKLRGLGVKVKVRKRKPKKPAPRRERLQARGSRGEKRRIPQEASSLRRGSQPVSRPRRISRVDQLNEERFSKRSKLVSRDKMQKLIEIERQRGPKITRNSRLEQISEERFQKRSKLTSRNHKQKLIDIERRKDREVTRPRRVQQPAVRNPLLILPSKRNLMPRSLPAKRNIVPSRLPNSAPSKKNLQSKKLDTPKNDVDRAKPAPQQPAGDKEDDMLGAKVLSKPKGNAKALSKSKDELSEERKALLELVKTAPLEGLEDSKLRLKVARNVCQIIAKSTLSECSLEAVIPIGVRVEKAMWDTTRGGDEEDELYRRRVRQFLFNLRSNMELMESVLKGDENFMRELVTLNNESLAKSSLKKDRERRQFDFTVARGTDLYECPECHERNAQLICQGVTLCHRADQEIIKCLNCHASFKAND